MFRITLHARRKARAPGRTIEQVREVIDLDDVCETMPNATDDRTGKRLYGRVGAREFHVILVVNPGASLHGRLVDERLRGRRGSRRPEARGRNPKHLGAATVYMHVYVDDVDAHHDRARAAGGRIVRPLADEAYGDRRYDVEDPEGHRWSFAQRTRDVAPADWGAVIPS